MSGILRKLAGVAILFAALPFVIGFAREDYGPAALALFLVSVGIGSVGLYFLVSTAENSRYPYNSNRVRRLRR